MTTTITNLRGGLDQRQLPAGMFRSFDELQDWWQEQPRALQVVFVDEPFLSQGETVPIVGDGDAEPGMTPAVPAIGRIATVIPLLRDVVIYRQRAVVVGDYVAIVGTIPATGLRVCLLESELTHHALYAFWASNDGGPPPEALWRRNRIRTERPPSFIGRIVHGPDWAAHLVDLLHTAAEGR